MSIRNRFLVIALLGAFAQQASAQPSTAPTAPVQGPITDINMNWPQPRQPQQTQQQAYQNQMAPNQNEAGVTAGVMPDTAPIDLSAPAVVVQPPASAPLARPPLDTSSQDAIDAWNYDPVQMPRQQGMVLGQPTHHGIFHSSNPSDQRRFQEWCIELQAWGINKNKILFEAKRRDRAEFDMWASRMVWDKESHRSNSVDLVH